MKQLVVASAVALAAIASAPIAKADLTLNGAVGLPLNPTAQIPQKGGVRVQADYFDQGDIGVFSSKFYGLHAAGQIAPRIELNGGVEKMDSNIGNAFGNLDNTGIAIGAKYLITRATDNNADVRVAAGVGYSRALLKNTHAYVVASKYLGQLREGRTPITGHLGLRYDRFSLSDLGGGKSNKASVYAGLEVPFTRTGDFSFVGELQSKNSSSIIGSDKIPFSASVRYRPAGKGYSASLGAQRQGLFPNTQVFVQIGYSFDTKQAGLTQ